MSIDHDKTRPAKHAYARYNVFTLLIEEKQRRNGNSIHSYGKLKMMFW
jgi:hypothetical protein